MRKILTIYLYLFIICSCSEGEQLSPLRTVNTNTADIKIYEEINSSISNINFTNKIVENKEMNSLTYDGMLQGAGVGILDYDNDGLQDIYFASNMEGDRLYKNMGDFVFKDVTNQAGIEPMNWSTGVAVVDINNDGYDDVYVCKFMLDEINKRKNAFYINRGDGTFINKAAELGVDDPGYGIMANFFDYDRDGDLDLYVANQPPNSLRLKDKIKGKILKEYTDKLFRNDGTKFIDVTKESGLENYNYSLSATTIDYNKDGWPDLYITSDYDEGDFFYKNNGDGTFTNVINTTMKHLSNFSMGVDIADINNDGHLDIFVTDMVAEDNFRQKTNMSGMNPERFHALAKMGHHYQYMFNTLQLNNGDNTFSEIAQLSGISNTDWSWTPLFIDMDQDGNKDLLVTNGILHEMRNKDFEIWRKKFFAKKLAEAENKENKNMFVDAMEVIKEAQSVKLQNYAYQNNGDLSFTKRSTKWGFDQKTWSQGAAYADFDNDGDLDIIMNNMQMTAGLYKNTANEKSLNNFISITLEGAERNKNGINAMIEISAGGETQIIEHSPFRGYMSSSQRISHFGLGESQTIDRIKVIWPDNKMNLLSNVSANQILKIKYADANQMHKRSGLKRGQIFKPNKTIDVAHIENEYNDFIREILLPYRTSTLGPVICEGDINGDGLDDIYVGSSIGQESKFLINRGSGNFRPKSDDDFIRDRNHEDGGAVLVDLDGDKDLDLYVSSGGNEFKGNSDMYLDRLYFNDGKGNFQRIVIPELRTSNSKVVPLDYDSDGDMDLFVGGRQVPGKYGRPVNSYILQNNKGTFSDVTAQVAPMFEQFGMVTDAKLVDLNNDSKKELVIVGEWMPISVYAVGNTFSDQTEQFGFTNTKGWWNTIEVEDVNGDGKKDIVAGNLGHNIKYKASIAEPFKVYVDDFDKNGSHDVYLGYYQGGQCFPVRGRQCSSEQMPFVLDKFETYKDFGLATIDKVLEGKLSATTVTQEAHTFSNTVFLNDGSKFNAIVLPNEAQISPVYGIAIDDFNKDGKKEIFLAGNMYQREVETTRSDAGKGCLLSFEKDGSISVMTTKETGISADKDVRAVSTIKSGNQNLLVIANNNDKMQMYSY